MKFWEKQTSSLIFFLLFCKFQAKGWQNTSIEEDRELERQLNLLNKPPIKTFQTKGGLFDCIDIYKQPAFDHPLLKNHEIQLKPTYLPKRIIGHTSSMEIEETNSLTGINCPQGTVPIQRTEKQDLIRATHFYKVQGIHPPDQPDQHVAVLKQLHMNPKYYGVHAILSLHSLQVKENQYSSSQMWIRNGPYDQSTSLQFGWMVSPQLNKDFDPHLFIYWTTDGSKTGCYNLLCPGFVQVDRKFCPGLHLKSSVYGGDQYGIDLAVIQDQNIGDWWLTLNNSNIKVGYWPRSLVPELNRGASDIIWGGLAIGIPNEDSPPMGNGYFPKDDFTKAASMRDLQVLNADDQFFISEDDTVVTYNDNDKCYTLGSWGYKKDKGLSFLFGGPGGIC